MENIFTQEQIDQYIKKELSPEKHQLFEEQLATNVVLQEEVAATLRAVEVIRYKERQLFLNTFSEIQENLETEGFFLDEDDLDDLIMGRVTEQKRVQIQQKLATDKQYNEKYQQLKKAKATLQYAEKEKFKATFKEVQQDLEKEQFFDKNVIIDKSTTTTTTTAKVFSLRKVLSIAAAVSLLLVSLWWIMRPPTTQNIYANYFEKAKDRALVNEVGNLGFAKLLYHNQLHQALVFYHQEQPNYEQALPLFEQYLKEAPITDTYYTKGQFFYALTLMELNQFDKTIPVLETLSQQKNDYQTKATFNLALAYLKTGQLSVIEGLLDRITTEDSYTLKLKNLIADIKTIEN